jgi:hypothetical protein
MNRILLDDLEKLFERRRLDVDFNQHTDHGNLSFEGDKAANAATPLPMVQGKHFLSSNGDFGPAAQHFPREKTFPVPLARFPFGIETGKISAVPFVRARG